MILILVRPSQSVAAANISLNIEVEQPLSRGNLQILS